MNHRSQAKSSKGSNLYPPTITIYQNPDHVDGLLQQAYHAPLITGENRESKEESTDQSGADGSGSGKVGGKVGAPGIGSIEAGISADYKERRQQGRTDTGGTTSNWVYTRAYYLHLVRSYLRENNLLKTVTCRRDTESLQVGDFVEYQATFTPNQVAALLDTVTPELVAKITRSLVQSKMFKAFDDWHDYGALQGHMEKMERTLTTADETARAITNAIHVDFRTDKTREFYGRVGADEEAVTMITICDNDHFTISDEDRILDGHFSVLGKVSAPATEDLPVLNRNKILDRLNPMAVDAMVETLNEALEAQGTKLTDKINVDSDQDVSSDDHEGGEQEHSPLDELDPSDYLNLRLESRVRGTSVKVIPVAIYV